MKPKTILLINSGFKSALIIISTIDLPKTSTNKTNTNKTIIMNVIPHAFILLKIHGLFSISYIALVVVIMQSAALLAKYKPKNIIIPEYLRDEYKGEKGTTQIQSSSRKVAKIDLQSNQILEIYDTIALAARENNCDNSAISKVCRGLRNTCGGYKWKYIENS